MAKEINHDDSTQNLTSTITASRGASLLMLVQMISKFLTFGLNQLLVRLVSPTLFGTAAYLELLYSTTLFFSREAERLSIQRTNANKNPEKIHQSIVNFGIVTLIIGLPISTVFMASQFYGTTYQEITSVANYFGYTVGLYWLLILVELAIEPIYSLNQYSLNFGKRSKYEGTAVLMKCLSTVSVVVFTSKYVTDVYQKNGILLLAFGIGQFLYSATLFICYFRDIRNFPNIRLWPTLISGSNYLDPEIVSFWKITFVQMIFKQILTEGDKFLVNGFFSVEERGVFSVMNNYGSIIVRILLNPIEESVRLSFTRSIQSKSPNLQSAITNMKYLMMFYMYLSAIMIVAGYLNSGFLLQFLLGGKSSAWKSTDLFQLMPWYVAHIPFLAFNGVLEAFFTAAANTLQTQTYSYFMSCCSILILGLMYVFTEVLNLGITGLILANTINMTIRIVYCCGFIFKFFKINNVDINLRAIVSFCSQFLVIGISSFYANYAMLNYQQAANFKDVLKSIVSCIGLLVILLFIIRDDIKQLVKK